MLFNVTHSAGVEKVDEILFDTPFDYMFAALCRREDCRLARSERTEDALMQLGEAMGRPALDASGQPATGQGPIDSMIPAAFTYLGQFIDHDVTARTDREAGVSTIAMADGRAQPLAPLDPEHVRTVLKNGRRPQLDLDSVYGDGPRLVSDAATEAEELYDETMRLEVQRFAGDGIDLPRGDDPRDDAARRAVIADGRNDENTNVSQLHAMFLAFNNAVRDALGGDNPATGYMQARRLTRWCYQYVVAHDYLMRVCDPSIVRDILLNGCKFFGPAANGGAMFMPLEFSVAGFRFGHSMIRPSYRLRAGQEPRPVTALLDVPKAPRADTLVTFDDARATWRVKDENVIEWCHFAEVGDHATNLQRAQKIDTLLARGLFELPMGPRAGVLMSHLAQRNLMRGYLLSMPTGQAMAAAMGIKPMREEELLAGESDAIRAALEHGRFQNRTPLWYYILREAQVQRGGDTLGAVGSRLVAETLIGFIDRDLAGYRAWLGRHPAVSEQGITLPDSGSTRIASLADMIEFAGVAI